MPRSFRIPQPAGWALAVVAAGTIAGGAPPASAQAVEPRHPVERTELGGRVHVQLNTTSAEDVPASELLVRRARIWAATRVNGWIDGAVQVDVSGASAVARFAFVRLSLSPAARLSFGQFKRAFDNFELTSSSQILVVERDGDVRSAGSCAGVGGVCSYSRFSEKLLFSSLDVGMLLQGEVAGGRVGYLLSATNGPGPNTREENDAKSFSGRVVWSVGRSIRLGANGAVHDYPNPVTGRDAFARAAALDIEVGDFENGVHVQAGILAGDNWRNLDAAGEESRFVAWQGIATYRFALNGAARLRAVEPVVRVSWGDPDRREVSDGGLLLSPGMMIHFDGRNKIAANVDIWRTASHAGV
ncbi:MAG: porin [Gemmatimonadota bacterium]